MITEQQLKARKSGIGGSDVGAILGLNKYRTALDIWFDKTSDEMPQQLTENKHIYFGNKVEPLIAEIYAEKNNEQLEEPTKMYVHKDYPFLLANPDRLIIGKNAALECKTCSAYRRSEWGEEFTDQVPHEYLLQIAHYRYVMDLDYIDLMVLIDKDFLQYRYVRNAKLEEKMIAKLSEFWNTNVLKRIQPAPMGRRDTDIMQVLDNCLEADEALENSIIDLAELKKQSKEIESHIKKKEDSICSAIANASKVISRLGIPLCSYGKVVSKRFNSTLFKQERPEEYEKYLKQGEARVFRISSSLSKGV